MAWTRQTPQEIEALFERQRLADPFGVRLHTLLAAGACFFAAWPTSYVSWAALPLLVCFVIRMWTHHRILGPLWWNWTARLSVAWSGWLAISLLWSPDRQTGADEMGSAAFLMLVPLIYPVLDRRRLLLTMLMLGFFIGNLSQVAQYIGAKLDMPMLEWHRLPGRNSGWWDPVVGGSVLCAALGVHGAGFALGRDVRERLLGALGCVVTLVCIQVTGTRGAWIASIVTLGAAATAGVLIAIIRGSRGEIASVARRSLVTIGGLTAALLLAGAIAWGAAGKQIRPRYEEAVREVRAALNTRDYSTFTGARLAMWEWAYAAWRCHPVVGVGAGGYQAWVQEQARLRAIADPRACAHSGPTINGGAQVHHHAHGLVPQVAATTGVVGLALLGGLMLTSIGGSVRSLTRRRRGDDAAPTGGYLGAGSALGLAGLLAAGLFDSITVNQQTWYIASLLLALGVTCAPPLPRPNDSPPATPR